MSATDDVPRSIIAPPTEPAAPHLARINDWLLGGDQNWAVDRAEGERLTAIMPEVRTLVLESRLVQQRVVAHAVGAGVTQFVDLASGLPTCGSVHETADRVRPAGDTRVVYVDVDPVVTAHAAWLLAERADPARHHVLTGDALDPDALWPRIVADGLIDPVAPMCVLLTALLHFVKDARRPAEHLARHRERMAPGSLLVLSQSTDEGTDPVGLVDKAVEFHRNDQPGQLRNRAELAAFLGDFELVDPGVTFAPQWRPDPHVPSPFGADPAASHLLVVVGCKPAAPGATPR
jgi:O-methyltransferase involved in polyketide biosynthesis